MNLEINKSQSWIFDRMSKHINCLLGWSWQGQSVWNIEAFSKSWGAVLPSTQLKSKGKTNPLGWECPRGGLWRRVC